MVNQLMDQQVKMKVLLYFIAVRWADYCKGKASHIISYENAVQKIVKIYSISKSASYT